MGPWVQYPVLGVREEDKEVILSEKELLQDCNTLE